MASFGSHTIAFKKEKAGGRVSEKEKEAERNVWVLIILIEDN